MPPPLKLLQYSTLWHILDNDNDSKYAYMKIFGQTFPVPVRVCLDKEISGIKRLLFELAIY
jgi:hypothetical protein